jgi:hypothetical protein
MLAGTHARETPRFDLRASPTRRSLAPLKTFLAITAALVAPAISACVAAETAGGNAQVPSPTPPESVAYREITGCVVDEDRCPMAGLHVDLMAVTRDSIGAVGSSDEEKAKAHGWEFTTDRDGRFTARFGKFALYDHRQATGLVEPGFGHFYFVVEKEGTAGGVSAELLNLNDEELTLRKEVDARNDTPPESHEIDPHLETGTRILTDPPDAEPVEIVVKRGIDVFGQIINPQGQSMPREEISVVTDMGADTHTGHGGEVFTQSRTTNRAGRFTFHHVYPGVFMLQTLNAGTTAPFWIRTRVRQRWIDKAADVITPEEDEQPIAVLIVATRAPIYRYFGRVTDQHGRGIAGAKVEIRCSMHEPELTYEDDHDNWWRTKTDRAGNYSLRVGYRFVNAIWIEAKGTKGEAENPNYDELLAPGRYDFTLARE